VVALSHVILHLGLCSSVAKLKPETTIAIHVHATDKRDQVIVDRNFRVERGDDEQRVVDIPWGIYRLEASVPKFNCNAADYFSFINEHDRSISETLADGPAPPTTPMLLDGTAPQSFLYVKPTFFLFDQSAVACNKPLPDPLPSHIVVENDSDAYYAWLYNDVALPAGAIPLLALRLKTPTHQYHYVRLPIPVQLRWGGWPSSIEFTVTEDMVDELASEPVDTLLCPKLWSTSAG
jgi:hypothetical protein